MGITDSADGSRWRARPPQVSRQLGVPFLISTPDAYHTNLAASHKRGRGLAALEVLLDNRPRFAP